MSNEFEQQRQKAISKAREWSKKKNEEYIGVAFCSIRMAHRATRISRDTHPNMSYERYTFDNQGADQITMAFKDGKKVPAVSLYADVLFPHMPLYWQTRER